MAGDWIKMRSNLWDDPRVTRLCDLTDQGEAAVIGALYWLWSAADQHTEDGRMNGLSLRGIDRKSGVAGIGEALENVGWIETYNEGVEVVRFGEHNGTSAKRRAQEASRKAKTRKASASNTDNVRTETGHDAELEKEKELEKELEKKKKTCGGKPPSRKTPLPENFGISDRVEQWAKEKSHGNLEKHFENFITQAQAKGYKYVDWDAALMNAVRQDWAGIGKGKFGDDRFRGAL